MARRGEKPAEGYRRHRRGERPVKVFPRQVARYRSVQRFVQRNEEIEGAVFLFTQTPRGIEWAVQFFGEGISRIYRISRQRPYRGDRYKRPAMYGDLGRYLDRKRIPYFTTDP